MVGSSRDKSQVQQAVLIVSEDLTRSFGVGLEQDAASVEGG